MRDVVWCPLGMVQRGKSRIEIKGELIYCFKSDTAMYDSGIKFISTDKQVTKFVTQIIKVNNHRKNNLLIAQQPNRLKDQMAFG